MKTQEELELHLKWLDENIAPLIEKKKAVENALKALEEPEFDFRTKMPVGSVWLGIYKIGSYVHHKNYPEFSYIGSHQNQRKTIYHAHQIIKAAQKYYCSRGASYWRDLTNALIAAEQDGVLQNLE